jgi:hypothetical protein
MRRSVLITGLARNVGNGIEREIVRLERAFRNFEEISFFVVESDSEDNTIRELEKLQSNRRDFRFISLGALRLKIPDRVTRIAFCRDVYMREMRQNPIYQSFDFVCIVDFDLENDSLSASGIESCFSRPDWCGVFANQKGAYYDIFALRAQNWSETNCWESDRLLREEGLDPDISRHIAVYSKMRKVDIDAAWIPVESAFGGLAIYRRECIADSNYQSIDFLNSGNCEHVLFNKSLVTKNHKLFINPFLTNFSWNDHNQTNTYFKKRRRELKVLYFFWRDYIKHF